MYIHSFIHLFIQTLSVHCMSGTVLGHAHTTMNRTDTNLCLHGRLLYWEETYNEHIWMVVQISTVGKNKARKWDTECWDTRVVVWNSQRMPPTGKGERQGVPKGRTLQAEGTTRLGGCRQGGQHCWREVSKETSSRSKKWGWLGVLKSGLVP